MNREFVSLPSFLSNWSRLGLSDSDLRKLESDLLCNPKIGAVIKGTGRARKMRFAFENRGKSGSVRIIYVDFEVYEKIYLVSVFQKSDQANLSASERSQIKSIIEDLEIILDTNK